MSEKKWKLAIQQFWNGFVSLVDSADLRAVILLKYVLLAQMLCNDEIDYLVQNEAKVYAQDDTIVAMIKLKEGVHKNDIQLILSVVNDKKVNLLDDKLIKQYLQDLLRNARLKALEAICRPYKAVRLEYLSKEMEVNLEEIRSLLAELILEERIKGAID